jgi:hypothetical protein
MIRYFDWWIVSKNRFALRSFETSISLYQSGQRTWNSNGTLFIPTQTGNWSHTINCDRDSIIASKRAIFSGITFKSNYHLAKCTPSFLHYASSQGPSTAAIRKKKLFYQRTELYESPGMWKNLGEGVKGDLNVGASQLAKSKYVGEETFKSSRRDMLMVTYSKALGQL